MASAAVAGIGQVMLGLFELCSAIALSLDFWAGRECPIVTLDGYIAPARRYVVEREINAIFGYSTTSLAALKNQQAAADGSNHSAADADQSLFSLSPGMYAGILFLLWMHVLVRRIPSLVRISRGVRIFTGITWSVVLGIMALYASNVRFIRIGIQTRLEREVRMAMYAGSRPLPAGVTNVEDVLALRTVLDAWDLDMLGECAPRVVQALYYPSIACIGLIAAALFLGPTTVVDVTGPLTGGSRKTKKEGTTAAAVGVRPGPAKGDAAKKLA